MKKVKKFSQRYLGRGVLIATTITAICGFLIFNGAALAASAGPRNAGTGTNVTGVGTIAWTNPGYITADDTNYATAFLTVDAISNYLQGTNYSFSIPSDATINGIRVSINRKSSASTGNNSVDDNIVSLIKGGVISGEDKASSSDWPTSFGEATYGDSSDLWGTTWAPADINASDFGVALSVLNESGYSDRTASVDYIQITVYYTPPAPDLTANKTDDFNGNSLSFNWTITITNGGTAAASFGNGNTILTDNLTGNNVTYGTPTPVNGNGTSGTVNCSITSNDLSCTASGTVNIPVGGTITITVPVNATAAGITLNNPRGGPGSPVCKVDPNNVVTETNDSNNTCSDSVSIPDRITSSATLNGGSSVTVAPGASITAAVTGIISDDADWHSTGWRINTTPPGTMTCANSDPQDADDYDDEGTYINNYTITAPGSPGTYNAYFRISGSNSNCGNQTGTLLTLPDAVTVQENNGTVIVKKIMVGDIDTFTYTGTPSGSISANEGTISADVAAGQYTSTETVPAGWDLDTISCDDNDSTGDVGTATATFNVDADETVTCTFTNIKRGTIIVEKQTEPNGVAGDFTFTGDAAGTISDDGQIVVNNLVPGTYTSTENDPTPAFDLISIVCDDNNSSGDIQTGTATFEVEPGETVTCTFTNTKRGSITVVKVADPEEGSFGFILTGPTSGETTIGDPYDPYTFIDLLPGGYSLTETLPEGWSGETNIACTDDMDPGQLTLLPGGSITCVFNNTEYGVIGGTKWHDLNADGIYGEEPVLSDWTIYLSGLDLEMDMPTDENGLYLFSNLLPGTYQICEELLLQEGWFQSFPIEGFNCDGSAGYKFNLNAGDTILDYDFGNYQFGSISGYKWNDLDGDGEWDDGEPTLSGWEIKLNDDEPVSTNENGFYQFPGLMPNAVYTVSEVLQEGWVQTWPVDPANYVDLVVVSGEDTDNNNFGNFQLATISGYKWEDRNNDGIWQKEEENTEPSLQNWEIKATKGETVKSTTTNENGYYQFTFGPDELGNWTVSETLQESWKQTLPADPGTYAITISQSGQDEVEKDFGNIRYYDVLGGKFAATSGDLNSTPALIVVEDSVITAPAEGGGNSTVSLEEGTVITRGDGENMDGAALTIEALAPGSLTGLATGVVAEGALKWGLENLGLEFDPAITVSIYVGTGLNGMTLNILRSVSGAGDWTNDGIVPPTACLVADGLCTFQATKASFYGAAFFLALPVPPAGGGGGGGGGSSGLTISPESIRTSELGENRITITWTTSDFSTSQVIYAREGESHTLDLTDTSGTPPKYGYARTTPEYDTTTKVTSHSVTIYDLSPGTVYYYRTVSHGSLAVSDELNFTTQGTAAPVEEMVALLPTETGGIPAGEEGIETPSAETPVGEEGVIGAPEEFIPAGEQEAAGPVTEKETLPETLLGKGLLAAVGALPFNLKVLIILVLAAIVVLIALRLFRKKR